MLCRAGHLPAAVQLAAGTYNRASNNLCMKTNFCPFLHCILAACIFRLVNYTLQELNVVTGNKAWVGAWALGLGRGLGLGLGPGPGAGPSTTACLGLARPPRAGGFPAAAAALPPPAPSPTRRRPRVATSRGSRDSGGGGGFPLLAFPLSLPSFPSLPFSPSIPPALPHGGGAWWNRGGNNSPHCGGSAVKYK